MKPDKSSYPAYYENYIPLVKQDNLNDALLANLQEVKNFISSLPAEKENFAYAPGKWTVKQVLIHIIDTERIMAYRALRFARKDQQQPLPFDENEYAVAAETANRSFRDLLEEFENVRRANICLFRSFSEESLQRQGNTASGPCSVLALGYVICGHATHHCNVISMRYLAAA